MKKSFSIPLIVLAILLMLTSCNTNNTVTDGKKESTAAKGNITEYVHDSEIGKNKSTGTTTNDTTGTALNDDVQKYTNKRFGFSVQFPKEWPYKVHEDEIVPGQLVSPDSGIDLYIEGNIEDRLSIFGMVSRLGLQDEYIFQETGIKTNSGLVGRLLTREDQGRKIIYFLTLKSTGKNYFAAGNVSLECFTKNLDKIMAVIRSIE